MEDWIKVKGKYNDLQYKILLPFKMMVFDVLYGTSIISRKGEYIKYGYSDFVKFDNQSLSTNSNSTHSVQVSRKSVLHS